MLLPKHNVSYNNVNTYNLTRLFILTTFLLLPATLFAANQNEKLTENAYEYLQQHYKISSPHIRTEINVNPISQKIKLKSCLKPIEFQQPRGNSSRITFKATCPSPRWQLFITARIQHFGPAVVATNTLARRSVIERSDIQTKEVELTNQRSAYFNATSELIGWSTKRSIAAGTIINATMVKPPLAVSKGNAVVIEAKRGTITIRATGTAQENGAIGEQIKVKNDRSGRIIKATVIERGLVRTP